MMNGKLTNGKLIQIFLIIIMAFYIGAKDIVAPLIKDITGKAEQNIKELAISNAAKITNIETDIDKLGNLAEMRYEQMNKLVSGQAQQSESILNIKTSLDKLEKRIDDILARK